MREKRTVQWVLLYCIVVSGQQQTATLAVNFVASMNFKLRTPKLVPNSSISNATESISNATESISNAAESR
jgi:hypothetical protein